MHYNTGILLPTIQRRSSKHGHNIDMIKLELNRFELSLIAVFDLGLVVVFSVESLGYNFLAFKKAHTNRPKSTLTDPLLLGNLIQMDQLAIRM